MKKEYFLKVINLLDDYMNKLNNNYKPNLRDIMILLIHTGRMLEFLMDKEVKEMEELIKTANSLLEMKEKIVDMIEENYGEAIWKELKELNKTVNKLLSTALDNIKLEL